MRRRPSPFQAAARAVELDDVAILIYTSGTTGRVERTLPFQFSFDETVDVGCDTASAVSPEYGVTGNEFTGTLEWVRIDLGDDSHDHLDPEGKLQAALIKQ